VWVKRSQEQLSYDIDAKKKEISVELAKYLRENPLAYIHQRDCVRDAIKYQTQQFPCAYEWSDKLI
jgi:hypothetical protein